MTELARVSCCVPFCRRTFKNPDGHTETLCGKHWRMASPTKRARKSRLGRAYKRRFGNNGYWAYPPGSEKRIAAAKLDRLCRKAWEACKRQAIERSAGI